MSVGDAPTFWLLVGPEVNCQLAWWWAVLEECRDLMDFSLGLPRPGSVPPESHECSRTLDWLASVSCTPELARPRCDQFCMTTAITRANTIVAMTPQRIRNRRPIRVCHSASFFSQRSISVRIVSSLVSSSSARSLLPFIRRSRSSIFSSWGLNPPSSPDCLRISWFMFVTSRSKSLNIAEVESASP